MPKERLYHTWFRTKFMPAFNRGEAKKCIHGHSRCSDMEDGICSKKALERLEESAALESMARYPIDELRKAALNHRGEP